MVIMFRRDFFATCIIGPLLGFTEGIGLAKPREYVHPELGKCVNHTLESHIDRESVYWLGQPSPYVRYVQFPIEVTLEIEYEYGCMSYCAFNVKPKDMIKISQMTIHQLLKYKLEPANNSYDLDGFQIEKYKFLISHICVYSNKKEDDGNQICQSD